MSVYFHEISKSKIFCLNFDSSQKSSNFRTQFRFFAKKIRFFAKFSIFRKIFDFSQKFAKMCHNFVEIYFLHHFEEHVVVG